MGASVSLWRAFLTLIVRVATTPSRRARPLSPSGLPLRARPKHASGGWTRARDGGGWSTRFGAESESERLRACRDQP